jgi:hypothetical protein
MLRQFLIDIHRKNPPAPDAQPIDGRQLERAALYENGPAPTVDEQGLKELLADAQLLTAGVLVICEGASEQIVIEGLVAAAVGPHALRSLRFHDLGGSGGAIRIQGLLDTFGPAMLASFVVVDREGQMGQYLAAASRNGAVAAEDVQLCDDSLEADNATPEELIRLVTELGRMPPQRPGTQLPEPAELRLTVQELEDYHRGRRERSSKNSLPGLADSLLTLARRPEHGSVNVEKLDLVEALTQKLISEIEATSGGALVQLKKRRPIVGFVLDRIAARVDRPRNL